MKYPLTDIVFEVTQDCNLNCMYCYNIWKADEKLKSKTKQSYKKTINSIKQLLKRTTIKSITFTGGEPMISERFKEVVMFCRMKGLQVNLISNGNAFLPKDFKILKGLGVGLFELPILSADPAIHDQITQVTGSWEKVMQSIKELKKIDCNIVGVFILTKINASGIGKTFQLIKELGIETIMLNRFNIGGTGIQYMNELICSKQELHEAFSAANKFASANDIFVSANVCTPWCYLDPKKYPYIRSIECSEKVSDKPITVDFEGNLRICNHSPVIIGNIFKHSFSEMLEGDYIKSWELTKVPFCDGCQLLPQCKSGCRGASEQLGLGLNEVDPIVNHPG